MSYKPDYRLYWLDKSDINYEIHKVYRADGCQFDEKTFVQLAVSDA